MFVGYGSYSVSELMLVQVVALDTLKKKKKKIRNLNRYRVLVKVRFWRNNEVLGLAVLKVPFSNLL